MKAVKGLFAVAALMMVLSACGLIPPVQLDDPLALDGQEATVSVQPVDAAGFGTLATAYVASGTYPVQDFPNVQADSPVLPSVLNYVLNIADSLTVTTSGNYPATIELSKLTFKATVFDSNGNAEGSASLGGSATFARAADCVDGDISCNYALQSGTLTDAKLSVDNLRSILFDGPEPNHANILITAELASDPALTAGSTISFVLEVEGSTASGF